MEKNTPKPICLLIGGSTDKQTYLSDALEDHVKVSVESPDNCVDTARSLGAKFAVVFWNRQTDQVAHRLTRSIPDLQVLVETNPLALQGRVERNGFSSVFDRQQNLDDVANDIKKLCRNNVPSKPSTSQRFPDLAASFLTFLPTLQASITEEQKLCDHLLNSLVQAAQASKGILFYSKEMDGAYSVFSRCRCGSTAKGQTIPLDSELASYLLEIESVVHVNDTDLPAMVRNHLRQFDCNFLAPIISELSLTAWIMLKINRAADQLDYPSIQTIAYFASESFRIGRELQAKTLRESFLQAGLNHALDAVLIVNEKGEIEFLSNKKTLLKLKSLHANSYRSLACGRLKSVIRRCLQNKEKFVAWPFESDPAYTISVQSLTTKGVMVAIKIENVKNDVFQIDGNVWREAFSPEKLEFWRQALASRARENNETSQAALLAPQQDRSSNTSDGLLSDLFSRASKFRHVSVLLPDKISKTRLSKEQFAALAPFLEGLFCQKFKCVQVMCRQSGDSKLSIEICCEELPANVQRPPLAESTPAQQGSLVIGILSLVTAGAEIKKEIASVGSRWIIEVVLEPAPSPLLSKPFCLAGPQQFAVEQQNCASRRNIKTASRIASKNTEVVPDE
jgi:hypothetical protein